jgi:hypothetical protein
MDRIVPKQRSSDVSVRAVEPDFPFIGLHIDSTAFFECCGCSVMFHDPAKFSVDRDEKAKRELAEKKQTRT